MKVLNLPFTKRLGITKSDKSQYLLVQEFSKKNSNHIGTMHASASYALAEITSGYFLNTHFSDIADQTIPILRASSSKYKKGCKSALYSKAFVINTTFSDVLLQLKFHRKCLVEIEVKLYDVDDLLISNNLFEWFITMKK